MRQSRKYDGWHYIEYPIRDGQTNPQPWDTSVERNGDNVLYGIQQSFQSMTTGLESTRGFYLAMLIHLVGDVHQPLHAAERDRDKGGNFPADRGSIKNLHALWDDTMRVRVQALHHEGAQRRQDREFRSMPSFVKVLFPSYGLRRRAKGSGRRYGGLGRAEERTVLMPRNGETTLIHPCARRQAFQPGRA